MSIRKYFKKVNRATIVPKNNQCMILVTDFSEIRLQDYINDRLFKMRIAIQ